MASVIVEKTEKQKLKEKRPSLTCQVIKGSFWVFSLKIVSQFLAFGKIIILARLLDPKDFGLFGMAFLASSILYSFSQAGVTQALVQKKGAIDEYLSTAWIINIGRNILIATGMFFGAPLVGGFFNNQQVVNIVRVLALSPLFLAFNNPKTVFFQKEFEFNKQFICEISAIVSEIVVAVTLAFLWRNVWALVWGVIAGSITRLVSTYIVYQYRPSFQFDVPKAKELFRFGKWVFGSNVLFFLYLQAEDLLIGKILGAAALGFYQMAYKISNLPVTQITQVISNITFPAYAKLQDNLQGLKDAYLRILKVTIFLFAPIAGIILVLAPDFTRLFMGKKWMSIVGTIQMLSIAGLLRSIMSTTGPVFYAVGKPRIETHWQIVRLLALAVFIWPLMKYGGFFGVSVAVVLSSSVAAIGFIFEVFKLLKCTIDEFLNQIVFPGISTLIMCIGLYVAKNAFSSVEFLVLFILLMIGAVAYNGMNYIFSKFWGYDIYSLIGDITKKTGVI